MTLTVALSGFTGTTVASAATPGIPSSKAASPAVAPSGKASSDKVPAAKATPKKTTAKAVPGTRSQIRPGITLPEQYNLDGNFVPAGPTRLLDTRSGTGTHGVVAKVGENALRLDVSQITGNPSVQPTAVVLNVTVTDPTTSSFLTVYPGDQSRPSTSNLNFSAGETVANQVTVPVGANGTVAFADASGSTDVVADLAGYYTLDKAAATYVPDGPTRLLDTRAGTGTNGVKAPVPGGHSIGLQIAGVQGVPATGVTAVVMNVTATDTTANGFLTVYPDGQKVPTSSSVNFTKGATVPNLVTVPVGTDGKADFYNSGGTTDIVADLEGYYVADAPQTGGVFQSLPSLTRFLDTRNGTGAPKGPVASGHSIALQIDGVGGSGGVPPYGVTAVVMNVTATDTTANGFLTVYPDGRQTPNASNVNFTKGETVPNLVTVAVGADGKVDFANTGGTTDIVADVVGYFSSGSALRLSAMNFSSPTVDAAAGSATETLTWTLTDSNPTATQTGGTVVIRQAGATPDSYVGQSYTADFSSAQSMYNGATLVSGNAASSTYSYTFAVPEYAGAASAKWVVSLMSSFENTTQLYQVLAGSELSGFASSFTATETVSTQTPTNSYIWLNGNAASQPDYVYGGVDNWVQYQLDAQDYQSGFWQGTLTVSGPGGRSVSGSFAEMDDNGQQSGPCQQTISDATCFATVVIPAGSPSGNWTVSSLSLTNNAGQTRSYTGLSVDPVTVTDDSPLSASGFKASPTSMNSWAQAQPFQVSMRIAGARGGISSIQLGWSDVSYCRQTSTTPTLNPDGSYSVPAQLYQSTNGHASGCQLTSVTILDGSGDVALYGSAYNAPSVGNVTVQCIADTTPPTASSAVLNVTTVKQSQIGNQSFVIDAKVSDATAPVNGFSSYLYDSTGAVVGQEGGGLTVAADGSTMVGLDVPNGLAVGTYTVGFTINDAGWLSTSYGPPKGHPLPSGPLTLVVTAG